MKAILCALSMAVLLSWVLPAPAQAELSPAALELLQQIETETARVGRDLDAEVIKLREKTAQELKQVQDQFCKETKLDEAVAVRDLIRTLNAGKNGPFSPDLPAAAREVYKQHVDQVAEINKKAEAELQKHRETIIADLQKVQDQLCKEAKLDEAVAIRDVIRVIRDGVTQLPDPGYVNHPYTEIGKVLYYQVTGVQAGGSIYGSDVYTTGSHLGMAAVHCGLLKPGQKGVVKVTILPGQDSYVTSTRNGVTSYHYGRWGVSFKVERVHGFLLKPPA